MAGCNFLEYPFISPTTDTIPKWQIDHFIDKAMIKKRNPTFNGSTHTHAVETTQHGPSSRNARAAKSATEKVFCVAA